MEFEELNAYDGTRDGSFPLVNESISTWRGLLAGVSVERAASICSGGEVCFFAILPRVKRELVAIDHSYKSLYFALGKYHMIEKIGTREAYKLLVENKVADLKPLFAEANANLPTKQKEGPQKDKWGYDAGYHDVFYAWGHPGSLYRDIGQKALAEFRKNRHKLRFLHADLNDLVDKGPFDLVYLSNAREYPGRDARKAGRGYHNGGYGYKIEDMVKPGGFVAETFGRYRNGKDKLPDCFTTVAERLIPEKPQRPKEWYTMTYDQRVEWNKKNSPPPRTYGIAWNYRLSQKAAA